MKAWIATFKLWLKIYIRAGSLLIYIKMIYTMQLGQWDLCTNSNHKGIEVDNLFSSDQSYNFRFIKWRLLNLDFTNSVLLNPMSALPPLLILSLVRCSIIYMTLRLLLNVGLLWWLEMNTFPSNVLFGRYHQVLFHETLCPCRANLLQQTL